MLRMEEEMSKTRKIGKEDDTEEVTSKPTVGGTHQTNWRGTGSVRQKKQHAKKPRV